MGALWVVVSVTGLFFLRIGVPLLILIGLGVTLNRWQHKRAETYPSAPPNSPHPKQPMRLVDYPQRLKHINHHSRS